MRLLQAVDGIDYGLLEEPDASPMACLLADAFSRFEPMSVALNLPRAQIACLVRAFVAKAISEQLTIVARDSSCGRLVGALLADDFGTPPPPGVDEAAPQFAPIGALLKSLGEPYRAATPVTPGTHAHIIMLGVREDSGALGIAGHLVAVCMAQARGLGYHAVLTEATGVASQQVFRRAGFQPVAVAPYGDFSYNGHHIFSAIQGAEGTILMTLQLAAPPPSKS
jgi:ribosomal protein S18 acetylase RimI-like enzyme